jgi:hypothetical protein
MKTSALATAVNEVVQGTLPAFATGAIRNEHDWATQLAWGVTQHPGLGAAGIRPLVEYRVNYLPGMNPNGRGNNTRVDLALVVEDRSHGQGRDVVALIECKMVKAAQVAACVDEDWTKLTTLIEVTDQAHPDGLLRLALGWGITGQGGRLESRWSVQPGDSGTRVVPMARTQAPWSPDALIAMLAPEQRAEPAWSTVMHHRTGHGFGGYRRRNVTEASLSDAIARQILDRFTGIQVHREMPIPPGLSPKGRRGRADLVITEGQGSDRILAMIECKSLHLNHRPARYPALGGDPAMLAAAASALRALGDTATGPAQLLHGQFPRDGHGRHLIPDHVSEDLLEMRKERRRMEALLARAREGHAGVATDCITVQIYRCEVGWALDGTDPETRASFKAYFGDLVGFMDACLHGDGIPDRHHRFLEAVLPTAPGTCVAERGAAAHHHTGLVTCGSAAPGRSAIS